jgi:hypothetical protein
MSNRLAWVNAQFLAPPITLTGQTPVPPGSSLVLTAAVGRIYFTFDGTDPRLPGGAVSPAARAFEQPIPVTTNLQVFARTQKENRWSSPLKTRVIVQPTVNTAKGN